MSEGNSLRKTVYCDGACRGNPGVGGYGVIIEGEGVYQELYAAEAQTTNNRMELTAAITGLKAVEEPGTIRVITDSQYGVKGMNEWISNWMKRGWKTASNKAVLNQDLWKSLLAAAEQHSVTWEWIRGHDGHAENERCDELANQAMDEFTEHEGVGG